MNIGSGFVLLILKKVQGLFIVIESLRVLTLIHQNGSQIIVSRCEVDLAISVSAFFDKTDCF